MKLPWLFIGRFQPFHKGHETLMRTKLDKGEPIVIALRNTKKDESNPYSVEERIKFIDEIFHEEIKDGMVTIITIPDIQGVAYGRGVGYKIEEIKLPKEIEEISATKIRRKQVDSVNFDPDVYEKPVSEVLSKHANIKRKPKDKNVW